MVPALLYLLYKKLKKQDWGKIRKNLYSRLFIRSNQAVFLLITLYSLFLFNNLAQAQTRNYKVVRKGNEIGWVTVDRKTDSSKTVINFASEVKASFIFTFSTSAKETSEFRDGTLQHSYFFRKTNGNIKADRHTRLAGSSYEVEGRQAKTILAVGPVTFNTLCMYFQEPVGIKQVYSDNCQCLLDIVKEPDGAYKIDSDGATNRFYYLYGICCRVEINSSFYSATLHLR